ncbi:hypothetical protein [Alteribacter aurantiacus]|nr:hypothetical protein [Alteribacter aurantiacus]
MDPKSRSRFGEVVTFGARCSGTGKSDNGGSEGIRLAWSIDVDE